MQKLKNASELDKLHLQLADQQLKDFKNFDEIIHVWVELIWIILA